MHNNETKCGFAAIVGRPNVGKSTLLNRILGQKISIVTPKPQTTRHRILGVKSAGHIQILFVDTPGMQVHGKKAIDKVMNKNAEQSIADSDLLLFITEFSVWKKADENVLKYIKQSQRPCIAIINKIDQAAGRVALLPELQKLSERHNFTEIFPVSALTGDNISALLEVISQYLPIGPWLYPEDATTDKDVRFLSAEIIREKLMMELQDELPYGLTVEIESWTDEKNKVLISAIIWSERESQKPIIIGKSGERLKRVGSAARKDIVRLIDQPVHLQLWAKTRKNWADNARALQSLGYEAND